MPELKTTTPNKKMIDLNENKEKIIEIKNSSSSKVNGISKLVLGCTIFEFGWNQNPGKKRKTLD